jgi:hypothetical protein
MSETRQNRPILSTALLDLRTAADAVLVGVSADSGVVTSGVLPSRVLPSLGQLALSEQRPLAGPDEALLELQRELARCRRSIEASEALVAAELAHRSRRELGYNGLAQRLGARTPELLVQHLTGSSGAAARRLVRVGTLVTELAASEADPARAMSEPWLAPVVRAATRGTISAEAVDAVRSGLGAPSENVSTDALAGAARALALEATRVGVDRLAALARERRDQLDATGVAHRELERRDRRYLRLTPLGDGMTRIVGLLDPESAAIVTAAVDSITSPRRGGPRFVDPDEIARAEKLLADERTTEQIALDALVDMVRIATRADHSKLFGKRPPAIRLLVTLRDLERRGGVGRIEGQSAAISIASVERHACEAGYVPVLFADDGQSLNLGREQRRHNARQRVAIATRDGGCLWPDCERPPGWTEVHHINEFAKGGATSVEDGAIREYDPSDELGSTFPPPPPSAEECHHEREDDQPNDTWVPSTARTEQQKRGGKRADGTGNSHYPSASPDRRLRSREYF